MQPFDYKPFDLSDFSGGMTDNYVNGQPNRGQYVTNMYPLINNTSGIRWGTELDSKDIDPQIPSGSQRINALINYDNDGILFVHAGQKLYFRGDDLLPNPLSYSTVKTPWNSNNIFDSADFQSHVSHTQWNKHLIVASDQFHRPAKVFKSGNVAPRDGVLAVTAGLPKPQNVTYIQVTKSNVSISFYSVTSFFAPSWKLVNLFPEQYNSGQMKNYVTPTLNVTVEAISPLKTSHYFALNNHGLQTGDPIQIYQIPPYQFPSQILPNVDYFVLVKTKDTFQICATYDDALAGSPILTLTPDGSPAVGEYIASKVDVRPVYTVCYSPAPHGLTRGEKVQIIPPAQTPPTNWENMPYRLLANTTYYVVPVDANQFFLTKDPAVPTGAKVENPVSYVPYHQGNLSTITYPIGEKAYAYAALFKYEYKIGDQTFIDRSAPVFYQVTNANAVNEFAITVSVDNLVNQMSPYSIYDVTNITAEFYRTIDGGQEFYRIGEVANPISGTANFVDNFSDTAIQNNEQIYTSAGVPANDMPPMCKFVHTVNNFTYYAHIKEEDGQIFPSLIRQSQGLDPDSVPASFNDELEDEITGISSVQDVPIVGCRKHIYRIDGNFDELGRGGMSHRRLSDHAGCISHDSFVQAEGGLYWFGSDGIYFTEGFKCQKVTDHLNARYKQFVSTLNDKTRKIKGVYDPYSRSISWTISTKEKPALQEECDALWVLDLRKGVSSEMPSFLWNGFSTFNPTAICMFDSLLHRADRYGYVLRFKEDLVTDPKIVAGTDPNGWYGEVIIWNFRSVSSNFGSGFSRKTANKLLIDFEPQLVNLNPTTISIQITAINDNGRLVRPFTPIRWRKGFIWGQDDFIWGDPSFVWYYGGVVSEDRRFPAKGLRFNYLQMDFTNARTNLVNSDIVCEAVVDATLKTITLTDLSKKWLADAVDYTISLELNNYVVDYLITTRTDTTLVVQDPLNTLVDGTYRWQIKGIKKGEKFNLVGMSVSWANISRSYDTFNQGDAGGLDNG